MTNTAIQQQTTTNSKQRSREQGPVQSVVSQLIKKKHPQKRPKKTSKKRGKRKAPHELELEPFVVEVVSIDLTTCRMLSDRSTI